MRPLSAEPRYVAHPGQRRVQMGHPAPQALRRDPAPSRLAFRLQRLWLTPFVRLVTRIGVPIFAVTLGLGLWLGDQGRRAELIAHYEDAKAALQNRPEFRLSTLEVEGATPEVEQAVRALIPVALPTSRFSLDLDAYRSAILRLDAVKSVGIVVHSGGTLAIKVTEREPVILWRTPMGIEMLDESGHRTASLTRRDARPDLPLIAGEGADKAVPEALEILAAASPILPRARGLVRVGERRWDLVLDRGQRILLPAENPVRAVERTLALDKAEDLLARDFTRLDLRLETRPTIRLSEASLAAFRQITGQKTNVKASP